MIHFIRSKNNDTIVDIEAYQNNEGEHLRSVVLLAQYTDHLLSLDSNVRRMLFMQDMERLQDIREEYYEIDRCNTEINKFIANICMPIAKRWNLYYITD